MDLADTHSIELGFDLQEAVTQRLAQRNKKTVQLNDLMTSTKFTKQEICTMYRGFKQVSQGNKWGARLRNMLLFQTLLSITFEFKRSDDVFVSPKGLCIIKETVVHRPCG